MRYYLGIDGGSSSTAVALIGEDQKRVWSNSYPALSAAQLSSNTVAEHTAQILRDAEAKLPEGGSLEALGLGISGLSRQEDIDFALEIIRSIFPSDVHYADDHEIALWGALGATDVEGAILIAGNGAVAYGQDASGETALAGGNGHIIGDDGGGYQLGVEVLRAVTHALDGRGPETALTPWLEEHLREAGNYVKGEALTAQDIMRFVYARETTPSMIAALSAGLISASGDEDGVSIRILERAAEALADLVRPVLERLTLEQSTLVLAGSWLARDLILRRPLLDILEPRYPELTIVLPQADAATGAALLALHRAGSE